MTSNSLLDKRPDELFPRKHMMATDLMGRAWTVKIVAVKEVKVYNPRVNAEELKIAVCFEKAQRYLLVNKTQSLALFELTGAETARGWAGHRVMIVPARFKGKWTIDIMQPPHEEVGEDTEAEEVQEEAAAETTPVPA